MSKECWQLKNLTETTFCFQERGSHPCSEENCAVEQRIQELRSEKIEIDGWWEQILPHSICRPSKLIVTK